MAQSVKTCSNISSALSEEVCHIMLLLINEILLSLCCIFPFSHNSNMQFAATSVLISRFWSSEPSWNCRFYSSLCCPTIFAILSTYFVVIYFKRHHAPLSDCLLDTLSCCWDIYALLLSEIWIIFLFCSRRCESHLHAISTTCGAKAVRWMADNIGKYFC